MTGLAVHYPSAMARARELIWRGDTWALAAHVGSIGAANGHRWDDAEAQAVVDLLRAMPVAERSRLAAVLTHGRPEDPLPGLITKELGKAAEIEARRAELAHYGRQYVVHWPEPLVALVESERAAAREVPGAVVAAIRRTALVGYWHGRPIEALGAVLTHPVLNPGEAWADAALAHAAEAGTAWEGLLRHALTATAARPAAKWDRAARALIDGIGSEEVRSAAVAWLGLVGRPRTLPYEDRDAVHNGGYDPYNATALRGLVWLLPLLPPHPGTARVLGALVETSLRTVPGTGPRGPKIANAAVLALARGEDDASLGELARLSTRVTYRSTLKQIEAALEERAKARGLGRDDVEELAVPAYGLGEPGEGVAHRLGGVTGELAIRAGRATLSWRNAAGKALKGAPAIVRRDHAEELTRLRATVKDIDKTLSAQSERLDRQFLQRRVWSYTAWRERCLDHPVVGTLARRLLWTVDGIACGHAEGALRTLTGEPVPATGESTVELWHPVGRDPAEITAWRGWLERHGITQPFKQAHREVYPLTDAERATGTYSNRFAGHILRQHQFHSLAAVRGWRNRLRLSVDDTFPPAVRELPRWGLRAEFLVEGVEGDELSHSGSYLHVGTDRVRFYPLDAPENRAQAGTGDYRMAGRRVDPLPLEDIPPLVLSEVLRDVDLFVGVASVGNDPTWQDGGPGGRHREYWASYGFGELTQGAETRREVLARLLPRLAIADRCSIEGRFLHVRGVKHTYKIHFGSGNILMTPDDRYLCIVPAAGGGAPDTGRLPFEGDRTLTVILSKAFLLAHDTEITDPTIVSQL
ncbi:DUF4132 domain-containing protein [Streptomyces sp. NPDC026673]|uniref:DUF4132 domain-containing protein n=1 Tax=Streptomyces sp. NPDC026673 TaxID=3155724 RepID=UPI003410E5D7